MKSTTINCNAVSGIEKLYLQVKRIVDTF